MLLVLASLSVGLFPLCFVMVRSQVTDEEPACLFVVILLRAFK